MRPVAILLLVLGLSVGPAALAQETFDLGSKKFKLDKKGEKIIFFDVARELAMDFFAFNLEENPQTERVFLNLQWVFFSGKDVTDAGVQCTFNHDRGNSAVGTKFGSDRVSPSGKAKAKDLTKD